MLFGRFWTDCWINPYKLKQRLFFRNEYVGYSLVYTVFYIYSIVGLHYIIGEAIPKSAKNMTNKLYNNLSCSQLVHLIVSKHIVHPAQDAEMRMPSPYSTFSYDIASNSITPLIFYSSNWIELRMATSDLTNLIHITQLSHRTTVNEGGCRNNTKCDYPILWSFSNLRRLCSFPFFRS